jgi:cardiolipin synthase
LSRVLPAVWEEETLFHEGNSFFDGMIREFREAQSIDFETYIYENDELGRRLADEFAAAARRGARVRVMVDGVGSPTWISDFLPQLSRAGVETRVFHPLPFSLLPIGLPSFRTWVLLFKKINRRNHRKVAIVDQKTAWVGSMNVSACHISRMVGKDAWRDSGVRVSGPPIERLVDAFEQAWRQAWFVGTRRRRPRWSKLRAPDNIQQGELVRLNYTRSLRILASREFLRRIVDAKQRVWITNPYFIPNSLLVRALRYAAMKGVDVRLIVPRKPDLLFMRWVASAFYGELITGGVRIFEYLPRVLHAKTFLIDEWVSVGSNNLNHRSMIHDLEVDIGLTLPESHVSLERQFLLDMSESQEVGIADWRSIRPLERLAGKLILYFKHFL